MDEYINDSAPQQVNIPSWCKDKLIKAFNQHQITNALFMEAREEILKLMSTDSFKRSAAALSSSLPPPSSASTLCLYQPCSAVACMYVNNANRFKASPAFQKLLDAVGSYAEKDEQGEVRRASV